MPELIKTYGNGAKHWDYGALPLGDDGIDMTIQVMAQFARKDAQSEVVRKIAEIIRKHHSTDTDQIFQAFKYVVDNVSYTNDGENEFVASPRHVLTWLQQGDCDDMATSLNAILIALGFQTYFKVIAWKPDDPSHNFTHVYSMVLVPSMGKIIPLDPVMEMSGFGNEKQPVIREKVFKL